MSIAAAARRAPITYRGAKHVALYVINYGARGFYAPFISLYLVSLGYSPIDIGLLAGLSAVVRIVVVPAYSALVDRLGVHRRLLNVQLAVAGLASLTMVLWPNRTWLGAMYVTRDAVDVPGSALMSQLVISGDPEHSSTFFARLRAMGSLGWAIAAISAGWVIGIGGYTLLILLSGILNIISLPLLRILPERTAALNTRVDKPPRRKPAFWLMMFSNFLYYVCTNAVFLFLWVYLKDYLDMDDGSVGVVAAALGLFEIPWMMYMNRIYQRISTRRALAFGIAGQAVFALLLAFLTGPSLLMPLIALRGVFYAMHNISLTLLVTEISHPANVATNQALAWVTIPAIAAVLTGPLAGWIYENVDARAMFTASAVIGFVASLILLFGRKMIAEATADRQALREAALAVPMTVGKPR
ncbi:MAG: MFS transporter [Chloroflexi bacterium]|nr:MFS transporter [Chloroflexota bacterium]